MARPASTHTLPLNEQVQVAQPLGQRTGSQVVPPGSLGHAQPQGSPLSKYRNVRECSPSLMRQKPKQSPPQPRGPPEPRVNSAMPARSPSNANRDGLVMTMPGAGKYPSSQIRTASPQAVGVPPKG